MTYFRALLDRGEVSGAIMVFVKFSYLIQVKYNIVLHHK